MLVLYYTSVTIVTREGFPFFFEIKHLPEKRVIDI